MGFIIGLLTAILVITCIILVLLVLIIYAMVTRLLH